MLSLNMPLVVKRRLWLPRAIHAEGGDGPASQFVASGKRRDPRVPHVILDVASTRCATGVKSCVGLLFEQNLSLVTTDAATISRI